MSNNRKKSASAKPTKKRKRKNCKKGSSEAKNKTDLKRGLAQEIGNTEKEIGNIEIGNTEIGSIRIVLESKLNKRNLKITPKKNKRIKQHSLNDPTSVKGRKRKR